MKSVRVVPRRFLDGLFFGTFHQKDRFTENSIVKYCEVEAVFPTPLTLSPFAYRMATWC